MTHLTKTEPQGLFNATSPQRPNRETGNEMRPKFAPEPPRPFAVGVDMTPDEARKLRMAGYSDYDWPSVSNLQPRKRGHHY